jgi:hypothetical protein
MLFISPQEAGTETSSTQLSHQYCFPNFVMFLVKPYLHIAAIMIAFKKSLARIYLQKWMLHKDYNKKWTLLKMCKFSNHPEIFFYHNEVRL